jgi:hypothetical protein
MSEERDAATPDEDPRQTGMADQLPEENPEGQGAGSGRGDATESGTDEPDAPDTSREGGPERDPGKATGNPRAAG